MRKTRVLLVCVHNSARSQMAKAILNRLAGDRFEACSAGLTPTVINPLAIAAMKDWGVDISQKQTRSVFELYKKGEPFEYLITVCDPMKAEQCPVFPGIVKRLHWSFPDPSDFTGTFEEKLEQTKAVGDAIRSQIEEWLKAQ